MNDVCGECGAPTEVGEDFCGECGAYLEWEERRALPEEQPTESAPEEEPEEARTLVDRVKAAVGVGPAETSAPAESAARTEVPDAPPPTEPTGDPDPSPTEREAASPATAGGAAPAGAEALVVRVPPPPNDTGPRKPDAVKPGRPAPRAPRRPVARDREPLNPGDLVCGSCGAGNKPTRKFCRRCGNDLAEAEVAKIPWWRRVFRRRPKEAAKVGTRPGSKSGTASGVSRRMVVLIAVTALVVIGAYLARGLAVAAFEMAVDQVQGDERFPPTGSGPQTPSPATQESSPGTDMTTSTGRPLRQVVARVLTWSSGSTSPSGWSTCL